MPAAKKISITLTPEMDRMIRERVEEGSFASSSELIREALRVWRKQEDEHRERLASIRMRIQESIDDPHPPMSLAEARADFKRYVAARGKPAA